MPSAVGRERPTICATGNSLYKFYSGPDLKPNVLFKTDSPFGFSVSSKDLQSEVMLSAHLTDTEFAPQ